MATYQEDYENGVRTGTIQSQYISMLDPTETGVNIVLSGEVQASLNDTETALDVNLEDMKSRSYHIRGLGFRKGAYTETLLSCKEVRVPFRDPETDEIQYVRVPVDSRTSLRNWIYLWAAEDEQVNVVSGSWISEGFTAEEGENYYDFPDHDEFDYGCSVARVGNIIFLSYEHPTYRTTDPYNAILGNAIAEDSGSNLYKPLSGGKRYKVRLEDYHKYPGVGATHVGSLTVDNSYTSKIIQQDQYISSFIQKAREDDDDESTLQTLELPFISYRAISASVYVDRFEGTYSGSHAVSASLEQVWKDLQAGNVDDSETIYFVERAKITGSGDARKIVGEQKTSIPVTGSILFKLDKNIAVRHTMATVYAPFINTVYRTNRYGVVVEMFSSKSLEDEG